MLQRLHIIGKKGFIIIGMRRRAKKYFIGIDIGGTKILAALLNEQFEVLQTDKAKVDANKGEKVFFDSLIDGVKKVCKEGEVSLKEIQAIGIGCPGMIKNPDGIITLSPNISFMKNYPLAKKVKQRFKVPVVVENDVNAGLYGEHAFGAAKGVENVVGIFLGTGVGGAMILNGQIYRGTIGAAGEIGHTFLSLPSLVSSFDREGTLEAKVGRHAISSEAGALMLKQQAPVLFEQVGYDVKKIKSKALLKSIQGGDIFIQNLIEDKARIVGISMANVVNLLNPQMIVLGGGVVESMEEWILPPAKETMQKYAMPPIVKGVKVVAAKCGDYAIVKGAAKLAFDTHLAPKRKDNE